MLKNMNTRVKWINTALDYCDGLTDYVSNDDEIVEKDKKLSKFKKKFYETGNPLLIFQMSRYKDCYLKSKQLLGDIYTKYISR